MDDDGNDRQLVEIALAREGFSLVTAASGEEALAMVAQQPPDLIVLDAMMPRMDGYQVAGKIKGNLATKNIPVIMLTGLRDRIARITGSPPEPRLSYQTRGSCRLCVRCGNCAPEVHGDIRPVPSMLERVKLRPADLVERRRPPSSRRRVANRLRARLRRTPRLPDRHCESCSGSTARDYVAGSAKRR